MFKYLHRNFEVPRHDFSYPIRAVRIVHLSAHAFLPSLVQNCIYYSTKHINFTWDT